jgi:DNA-binding transcriptional LysR family regulator
VTVVEEGQMTRAARRLQLAQPALSQAIARLESQVGVRLLERNPRGVSATAAGEAFMTKAQATLAAVDEVSATARSWAREQSGKLLVGFMSMTPPMMAGDVVSRFGETQPAVAIEWRELGYPTLDARAWLGEVDAALIYFAPSGPGLTSQAILTSPLVVVMSEAHPLADRAELKVEDVLAETFPGIAEWVDPGWLGHWGLDRYRGGPAHRTGDAVVTPAEVASIVASGRAITTVPAIVAIPYAHLGIRAIPLVDARPAVLNLVWREGTAKPLVAELVDAARQIWTEQGK